MSIYPQCHPDLFPNDDEKTREFQELQEAYSVLSDTKKRAEYTQMQRAAQSQGPPASSKHPYADFKGHYPFGNNRLINKLIDSVTNIKEMCHTAHMK